MTLEKLLQCSADELEKMTTKELEEFFKPYLQFTRPEMVTQSQSNKVSGSERKSYKTEEDWTKAQKKKKAQEMARQLGIELKY